MDPQNNRRYEFGPYVLDEKERLLLRFELAVSLPPKAFDTLLLLIKNSGHIMEKEELINALWPDAIVEENNLTHYISLLRRELGDSPSDQQYIETVTKHGYRFVAEVRVTTADSTAKHPRLAAEAVLAPPESETVTAVPRAAWWRLPTSAILGGLVLLLAIAAAYLWISRSSRRDAAIPSQKFETLAILPFKTLDPDSTEEYLSFGIADGLITKLSGVKNVVVRPLPAVRKYSKPGTDPSAIGKELQVDAVLDGSVHRVGDSLRVTAQLVSVSDGKVLWTEKFERPLSEVQALGEVISGRVTTALALRLDEEERSHLAKRYTENAEAYEAYLKGRFFIEKRTEEGFRKGLEYFQRAVELDPKYAPAYVGQAQYYLVAAEWLLPREEAHHKSEIALSKALEIDDNLAEGHAFLALLRQTDWDWKAAEKEIMRALELNPRSSLAHLHNSYYLMTVGRSNESYDEMKLAKQLDPVSAANNARLAALSAYLGRYDESLDLCRKAVEIDPSFTACHDVLGWVYLKTGKPAEAVAELETSVALSKTEFYPYGELGYAYAVTGNRVGATKLIRELKGRRNLLNSYPIAVIYTGLGQKDEAFSWLNDALTKHEDAMTLLKFDPYLESLRADPRFTELLRRVGLPTT